MGLSFAIPPNWKVADRQVVLLLGSDTEARLILIRFMRKTNGVALRQGYQEGLEEEGTRLAPAMQLERFIAGSNRGLAGEMAGFAQNGKQLRARVIGALTPLGDAAVVLGITSSDKFAQLKPRVDALVASLAFTEPPLIAANEAIAGQYMYYYSSNSGSLHSRQDVLSLCFNGEFTRGGETHTTSRLPAGSTCAVIRHSAGMSS